MKPRAHAAPRAVISIALTISAAASGTDFDLDWFTVNGGGATWTAGGDFELSGTIGQVEAGTLVGGDYDLIGGFWGGVTGLSAPGDCDGDGDIDLDDFQVLAECLLGPDNGLSPDCDCADSDVDGDADLRDCANFQQAFTGP